jgi:hypothetical protein
LQLFPWIERSVMPSVLQDWLELASKNDVAKATGHTIIPAFVLPIT